MFEYREKTYDFKFSIGRIDLIEQRIGTSLISIIGKSSGAFPVSVLTASFGFAVKSTDTPDVYLSYKDGKEMAEAMIEELGYFTVNEMVADAMMRDLPFFFQTT